MAGNIQDYTNPITELRPSEMAPNAARQAGAAEKSSADSIGRDIGSTFSAFGQLMQKHQDVARQEEVQKGLAAFSMNDLRFSQDWDSLLKTVNGDLSDPRVQAFLDQENAKTDDLVASATTPQTKAQFEAEGARQKNAHFKVVTADKSIIASNQAAVSIDTYIRGKTGLAFAEPDRAEDIRKTIAKDIDAMIPQDVDPTKRSAMVKDAINKVQQGITRGEVNGMIQKDPQGTLRLVQQGYFTDLAAKGLIDEATLVGITDRAQAEIQNQKQMKDAGAAERARQNRAAYDDATTKLVASTLLPDGTRSIGPDFFKNLGEGGDVATKAALVPGGAQELESLANWGRQIIADRTLPQQDNVAARTQLETRFYNPGPFKPLTHADVIKAYGADHSISSATMDHLNSLIDQRDKDKADPGFTASVDRMSSTAYGLLTPDKSSAGWTAMNGDQQSAAIQREQAYHDALNTALAAGHAAGKSVLDMLNPGSKDYVVPGALAAAISAVNVPAQPGGWFGSPTPAPDVTPGATQVLGAKRAAAPAPGATPAAPAAIDPARARGPNETPEQYLERMKALDQAPAKPTQAAPAVPAAGEPAGAKGGFTGTPAGTIGGATPGQMGGNPAAPAAPAPAAGGIDFAAFGTSEQRIRTMVESLADPDANNPNTKGSGLTAKQILSNPDLQSVILKRLPAEDVPGAQKYFDQINAAAKQGNAAGTGGLIQNASFTPGNLAPDANLVTATTAILKQFEGFDPVGRWDRTQWTGGIGSNTITKEDGTIVHVTKGMKINPADAERDLQRQIPILAAQVHSQVGDVWTKWPPKVQAVLISLAYNYGHVPYAVVNSLSSGSFERVAEAISGLKNRPGVQNPERRDGEAAIVRQAALETRTQGVTNV